MPPYRYPRRQVVAAGLAALFAAPAGATVDTVYDQATERLACKCGACGNSISTCKMMGCHYCTEARPRIRAEAEAGKTADEIVQGFIDEMGVEALISPPTTGWGAFGWAMPFAALALGLAAAPLVVMTWRKQHDASAADKPKAVDPAALDRFQAEIEQELEERD